MPENISDKGYVALVDRGIELAPGRVLEVGGKKYLDKDKTLTLIRPSHPGTIKVTTLSGIVALLENRLEALNVNYEDLIIQVDSFESVCVFQRFTDGYGVMPEIIKAAPIQNEAFRFNQYYRQEEFNIKLASLFVPDDNLAQLIQVAGSLAKQMEVKQEDNGISQTVTARAGVHMVKEITLAPRVTLKPYRTFREAEQPASDFVFRVKADEQGNLCALFEADGGYWKIAAMQNVAAWLLNRLRGTPSTADQPGQSGIPELGNIPVIY